DEQAVLDQRGALFLLAGEETLGPAVQFQHVFAPGLLGTRDVGRTQGWRGWCRWVRGDGAPTVGAPVVRGRPGRGALRGDVGELAGDPVEQAADGRAGEGDGGDAHARYQSDQQAVLDQRGALFL